MGLTRDEFFSIFRLYTIQFCQSGRPTVDAALGSRLRRRKMAEITLTSENFKAEVLESKVPVLVDFWATWCGPCQMMGPVVEELANESDGSYKVGKVNVDEQGDLAQEYGIMSIPAFFVFKDGKVSASTVGAQGKDALLDMLK